MRRLRSRIGIYLRIASMGPQIALVYRFNLMLTLVAVLLQVFLLREVWAALYAGQQSVDGFPRHTLVTYLTLTNLQMWLLYPSIFSAVRSRVHSGAIALDLVRPVGFPGQMLAQQLGTTLGAVPFLALTLPLAALAGGLQVPASLGAAACYVISLILAYVVMALLGLLLGFLAFWTVELGGFIQIYTFISLFFSGALAPIRFFPPGLRVVAAVLPFQALAGLPISIYLGQEQGVALLRDLGVQSLWVLVLGGAACLVWRSAVRHVAIQGG
jgi:ABC-2 type transport system permease protein